MNLALAEMDVQGVSTRRVITVLQSLLGPEISISSTQISRCTEKLDSGLEAWRNRSLGVTPYVVLDARYEKVRTGGQVVDCAVLIALGIDETGKRRVLGVSVALSVTSGCKLTQGSDLKLIQTHFEKMAAFWGGVDKQRGVCGSSVTQETWIQSSRDSARGWMRSQHGSSAITHRRTRRAGVTPRTNSARSAPK